MSLFCVLISRRLPENNGSVGKFDNWFWLYYTLQISLLYNRLSVLIGGGPMSQVYMIKY